MLSKYDQRRLRKFCKLPHGNDWFNFDNRNLSVYLRNTIRYIDKERVKVIDIANLSAKHLGTGSFDKFLKTLKYVIPTGKFDGIYVENILNARLEKYLVKQGFQIIENPGTPNCTYYQLEKTHEN